MPTDRSPRPRWAYPIIFMAAGALVACAPSTVEQVSNSQPSITYTFSNDSDLVDATRKAEDYCRTYQGIPRTLAVADDVGTRKRVTFVCDRAVGSTPVLVEPQPRAVLVEPAPRAVVVESAQVTRPHVSYVYRSDRELVEATQSAERFCQRINSRPRQLNVLQNADGSKTAQFDCQ